MPTSLVLESSGAIFDADTPIDTSIVVVPLHYKAHSVPVPTLEDGRPQ